MDQRAPNLLDEALGLVDEEKTKPWPLSSRVVLVEDRVETSGAFVLHHLLKRALSPHSSNDVVVFLAFSQPFSHYDRVLRKLSFQGCSLVVLNHEDIYSSIERPALILQMEYLADILIKAEPLATGLATDVHGQLTVLNNEIRDEQGSSRNKICNFHFRVKENGVEYFYPGSKT